MNLERRIHESEGELFDAAGGEVRQSYLELARTGLRVRMLSHGDGEPLLALHGVSLSGAVWAPLFNALPERRVLAVDLPGHGLSDPVRYRRGHVRAHASQLIDDLLDALDLERVQVVGHSLGGMFALWYAATGSDRISGLVAIGEPAVALAGTRVRMPLSLLAVPGLGLAVLRAPAPRPVYRRLLAQGLGHSEVSCAPDSMIEALRLSSGRPENARTVASLMHAINRPRRPRPESVLTAEELGTIRIPTMFILGSDDPYLSPGLARPSIEQIPGATSHELDAGHAPWLVHLERCAELIAVHLAGISARAPEITAA